jgi:uncharacterized small protein (DUF1192 family)
MHDDEAPRKPESPLAPRNYDGWSVSDFTDHIAALRAEIARAEASKAAKQASLNAAAGFFRTP